MVRKRRVATKVEVRAFLVVLVDVCSRSKIKCLWVCRMAARAGMRVVMFRIVSRARCTHGFVWWRRVERVEGSL